MKACVKDRAACMADAKAAAEKIAGRPIDTMTFEMDLKMGSWRLGTTSASAPLLWCGGRHGRGRI